MTVLPSAPSDAAAVLRPLGLLLALGLVGGCAVVALAGAAALVELAFPVTAVLGAGWLLVTRRSGAYVEFVLWLWLLGPGLRRIVDLGVGWTPVSAVMTAAPLATMLCLLPGLAGRRRVDQTMGAALLVGLVAVAYGLAVGVINQGVSAALASGLAWLPPLAVGVYVAFGGSARNAELRAVVRRTAVLGCLVLGGYGVYQFISAPAWDVLWLENAPIISSGLPEPFAIRVFSTLNAPAPFACVLGALLIILSGVRAKNRLLAMVVGFIAFGLSVVRTAWLGYAVATLALLVPSRVKLLRTAVIGLGVPVLLLGLLGGPVTETITDRFRDTTSSGTQDTSFQDRVQFYSTQVPLALRDPIGQGLGSTGVATKVANGGELGELGNFDGGLLEILFVFGFPVGLALITALGLAVRGAWRAASEGDDLDKAMAAALVGLLVQLPLFQPVTTPSGILFWLLIGLLARPRDAGTEPSDEGAAPAGAVA